MDKGKNVFIVGIVGIDGKSRIRADECESNGASRTVDFRTGEEVVAVIPIERLVYVASVSAIDFRSADGPDKTDMS